MPPKVRITKESIVDTALDIVRRQGAQGLNARNIASALNCSTQPIFSNFATMEALRIAVAEKADALFRNMQQQEQANGLPPYKAGGMAYIRFAKEEKELFKLIYMCDRTGTAIPDDAPLTVEMETLVQANTGLDEQQTKLFHLEMWAFVHGIATMFATGFLDLDRELVGKMLTDAYLGLRKQYTME